ncbi:MAG: NADH-dependent [FeFe] hydrogenase, group A6 [Clostridiales bacterium]|nr:NADH-dependent [FeFe] hydrogenase, group A6 [Clostridiales bacterium]
MVNIKINGITVSVPEDSTVLEAARLANIRIPTLCYLKEINAIGSCRICVVEVKGAKTLVASCVHPVSEGMEVFTSTPEVLESRKQTLELILSDHDRRCLSCVKSNRCELQALASELGVDDEGAYDGEKTTHEIDFSTKHMYRDNNKCVVCRRCVAACDKLQSVGVLGTNDRGFVTKVGCAFDMDLDETACVSCGQCIVACPTGALSEVDNTHEIWAALADPTKHVVVQTAPSVRVTLGEEFGLPIGTNVQGRMAAALRRLGFDKVFDTDFAADLTIMEEATELLERVKHKGTLPMITSCSPGWVRFCEQFYPDMIPNLSTCKSPQQMFGAIVKSYYAEKTGISPKDIVVVSIMPCVAKKFELTRDDQAANNVPDVDISVSTRELGRMIRKAGIQFADLPDEEFDSPLGLGTGAGHIFGATGGVMEAALRTAVETLTGERLDALEFEQVRGTDGIKEASYSVAGLDVKVGIANGLGNARKLLDSVKSGEKQYHFIEIMACPGGCVNGGGQPVQFAEVRNFTDLKALRAKGLYDQDQTEELRRSHDNPDIKKLYEEYLGEPGGYKSHHLLHTSYKARNAY